MKKFDVLEKNNLVCTKYVFDGTHKICILFCV